MTSYTPKTDNIRHSNNIMKVKCYIYIPDPFNVSMIIQDIQDIQEIT